MIEGGSPPTLRLENLNKSYDGTKALRDVSVGFRAGTIHAILGENGAGKTTLVEVLAGNVRPDDGQILLEGVPTRIHHAADAWKAGIAVVHQHPSLAPNLTVAENILAMRLPGRAGMVSHRRLYGEAQGLVDRHGVSVDVRRRAGGLPVGLQQQVEIVRALSSDARVIALDEPTSSLSVSETAQLFEQLDRLRSAGGAVILVTHRIRDVFETADEGTVLRDGHVAGHFQVSETDESQIVHLMLGRALDLMPSSSQPASKGPLVLLRIEHVSAGREVRDVSLEIRAGEIVGLYGLVGAGCSELAQALFGLRRRESGHIELGGIELPRPHGPSHAIRHGMAFLPEDRLDEGLFTDRSVAENLLAPRLAEFGRWFLSPGAMLRAAHVLIDKLSIKGGGHTKVSQLSGGNQQKVLLGRWLSTSPSVLVADEPTRGVDVGTKAVIHQELRRFAEEGRAVALISSDVREVLSTSDRVYVMAGGAITDEFDTDGADEERLLRSASSREDH